MAKFLIKREIVDECNMIKLLKKKHFMILHTSTSFLSFIVKKSTVKNQSIRPD